MLFVSLVVIFDAVDWSTGHVEHRSEYDHGQRPEMKKGEEILPFIYNNDSSTVHDLISATNAEGHLNLSYSVPRSFAYFTTTTVGANDEIGVQDPTRRGGAFSEELRSPPEERGLDDAQAQFDEKAREDAYRKSQAKEHPYAVGLVLFVGKTKHSYCSATLLSPRWVLTAAHCLDRVDSAEVYAGQISGLGSGGPDENAQVIRSSRLFPHPDYSDHGSGYDIGLIELEEAFNLTDYVRPIRLATAPWRHRGYRDCVVTAFGRVQENERHHDDNKRKTHEVQAKKPCLCDFFFEVQEGPSAAARFVCSKRKRDYGVCHGDSGSGLVCDGEVAAVASFMLSFLSAKLCKIDGLLKDLMGKSCGREDTLSVYHDACPHLEWINGHTKLLNGSEIGACAASGAEIRHRLAAWAVVVLASRFVF